MSTSEAVRSSSNADDGDEATSALLPTMPAEGSATEPLAIGLQPEEQVQLSLTVDEAAGAERPVTVRLAVRGVQLPPSPFDSPSTSQRGLAVDAGHLPATPYPSAASMQPDEAAAGGAAGAAAGSAGSGGASNATSPGEAAMREALLVQQFLDGHSSQLTYHGLVALQEGLRPNQLAVFFRCGGANAGWCGGGKMHGVLLCSSSSTCALRRWGQHGRQPPAALLNHALLWWLTLAGTTISPRCSSTRASCTSW